MPQHVPMILSETVNSSDLGTVIPEETTDTVEQHGNTCGHDGLDDDFACAGTLEEEGEGEDSNGDGEEELSKPAPEPKRMRQHNIYPRSKRKAKSKPRRVHIQEPDNGTEQFPIYVDIDGDVSLILMMIPSDFF